MVIVGKFMWVFTCCNSVQLMWEADMSDPKLCLHIGKFWLYILVLNFASLAMNGYFLHHVELLVQCTHWANGWPKGEHRQPFLHNGCKYQLWSSSSVCIGRPVLQCIIVATAWFIHLAICWGKLAEGFYIILTYSQSLLVQIWTYYHEESVKL
jgi:hypothetical protein